jgi:hypothetical protein
VYSLPSWSTSSYSGIVTFRHGRGGGGGVEPQSESASVAAWLARLMHRAACPSAAAGGTGGARAPWEGFWERLWEGLRVRPPHLVRRFELPAEALHQEVVAADLQHAPHPRLQRALAVLSDAGGVA